jgi:hypothetical protein
MPWARHVSCPSFFRENRSTQSAGGTVVKQGQTNIGKKEQRQIDQVLTKAAQGDPTKQKVAEARTIAKQHRVKGRGKS